MLLMPVCVAIVTENQTPSAMMKTLPLKSVEASTMTTGSHVVEGIAPRSFMKGAIQ